MSGFRDADGYSVSYALPGRARVLTDAMAVPLPEPTQEERIIELLAEILQLVRDDTETVEEPQPWAAEEDEGEPAEETVPVTRDQHRSRRKREVRARTISVKRMTKRELEIGRLLYPETEYWKPRTRAECADGPRPCPFVSCRHHLFIDVSPRTGAIKLNFPDIEVQELRESCAIDVADRGGSTLEEVAVIMNLTRERIRQIETTALRRVERRGREKLIQFTEDGPKREVRRLPILEDHES